MIIKKFLLYKVIFIGAFLLLNGCSGNKVVVTTDDSADYQSARQLPPLNKGGVIGRESQSAPLVDAQTASAPKQALNMSIVNISNNSRLKIDTNIDNVWDSLLAELKHAAITVHSRNTGSSRIEIGCGDVDEGAEVVKRGGWSLFTDDGLIYEYCVLQLANSNGNTLVSMLNRRGEEVSASEARSVFEKILNN